MHVSLLLLLAQSLLPPGARVGDDAGRSVLISPTDAPVSAIRHDHPSGDVVVVAVCRRMGRHEATIELPDVGAGRLLEALGGHGQVTLEQTGDHAGVRLVDTFRDCEVHVYRLRPRRAAPR